MFVDVFVNPILSRVKSNDAKTKYFIVTSSNPISDELAVFLYNVRDFINLSWLLGLLGIL